MTFEFWLVYLAAAIGLALTPGPNGLLCLTHSVQHGFRTAIFTALGGISGFLVLIAASLAGLGALLAASEQAFLALKLVGAAYLIYLGIRLWRAPPPSIADAPGLARAGSGRPVRTFRQGFLVAVSNPKALMFFAAFLPQFMVPGLSWWTQFLVLGGTFAVVELLYEAMIAGLARRIAPWLTRAGRWFNRVTGSTFIGVGGLLATANRA